MNYNLDVGQNLTSLGFAFLFLKYVLPLIFGLIGFGLALWGLKKLLDYLGLDISSTQQTFLSLIFALLIVIAFII